MVLRHSTERYFQMATVTKKAPKSDPKTAPETVDAVANANETVKTKRPPAREIDDAKLKDLSKTLYEVGGGTKTAVFRALFTEGYTIAEVFKNCQRVLWPKLIRPHVQNEHARWVSDSKG